MRVFSTNDIIKTLLFLFPLGAVSVEHWASGIFSIVCLIALVSLHDNISALSRVERLLLISTLCIYLAYLISTFLHGADQELGPQVRFFFFIPIYMLLKRHANAASYLLAGSLVSVIFIFAQSLYDSEVLNLRRANGFYGPLFLGSIASIFTLFSYYWSLREQKNMLLKSGLLILVGLGSYSVVLSVSRAAIGILIVGGLCITWVFIRTIPAKAIVTASIVFAVSASYFISDRVQSEFHKPFEEVQKFESIGDPKEFSGTLSSTGRRLTWMNTAVLIIKDNPWFGIGMFRYREYAERYVSEGIVNRYADDASHPHNMFLEMWLSRGLFGIISLIGFICLTYVALITNYRDSNRASAVGLIHLTGVVLFGLSESAPVLKGNYIAFFMLYSASFVAWATSRKPPGNNTKKGAG